MDTWSNFHIRYGNFTFDSLTQWNYPLNDWYLRPQLSESHVKLSKITSLFNWTKSNTTIASTKFTLGHVPLFTIGYFRRTNTPVNWKGKGRIIATLLRHYWTWWLKTRRREKLAKAQKRDEVVNFRKYRRGSETRKV